ncbi:sensor histidine kinase [Chitinimonas sp.]|uniref:sensor histidine kinase n=1 Tax=Chitinimonas sp. TaxID=1934313 RepID=UPI002F930394
MARVLLLFFLRARRTVLAFGLALVPLLASAAVAAEPLPPLRVGVLVDPPYVLRETAGSKLTGASVELAGLLAKQMGRELHWQVYDTPAQLAAARRAGQIDLLPLQAQTPEGLRDYLFSEPVVRMPVKLVARQGFRAGTLEELGGYVLALQQSGPVERFVRDNYPSHMRAAYPSERATLDALVSGQVDVALVDQAHARALVGRGDYLDLEAIGDAGYTLMLRVASRNDHPELAEAINEALGRLPASELASLQRRWLSPQTTPPWSRASFWQLGAAGLMVLLLLLAGSYLWQRRAYGSLRRQLNATEQQLESQAASAAALQLTQFSLDRSTVGVLWLGWDGLIRYANTAALALHGYPPAQLDGQSVRLLDPQLDVDGWLAAWHRVKQSGAAEYEALHTQAGGASLPVDVRLSYLRFHKTEYLVMFVADATERRRARAALEASEASMRELAGHIETVREEEKARIAREVHDELGQVLTGLRLEVSMTGLAAGAEAPKVHERVQRMQGLIDQTFQIVRSIASELRPPILNAGLPASLDWLARRHEDRFGVPVVVSVHEALPALPDVAAVALFRIAQEALTNIARHAHAETVRIDLTVAEQMLFLAIEDDGRGFDAQAARPTSFGLLGMSERAMAIGGVCTVESHYGEGTDVTVRLPLEPYLQEAKA